MNCIKCGKEIPADAPFCCWCGKKQQQSQRKASKRGNGTGSVYKSGDKWTAEVTRGYRIDGNKKTRVMVRKRGFSTKKEALEYIPTLFGKKEREKDITFRTLYDQWLPTHRAGKDTINCYKAAFKYFAPVEFSRVRDIDIDDLQECIDDCPHGKRTRQNMKAVCGLMYKYGIPRGLAELNMAEYLIVTAPDSIAREGFTAEQLKKIQESIGSIPYADYIFSMCYLGFRPSELLMLDVLDYDRAAKTLTGGAKTEAGKNRIVTISPKIQPIIDRLAGGKTSGPLFCDKQGKQFKYERFRDAVFYPTLAAIGIDNPIENKRHKYSPHSCRHTFTTLMKRVPGPDKDKQELIGHTSPEMLRYYQDVNLDDLRKITDAI